LTTPYRALSLETGNGRHILRLEDGREIAALRVVLATGAQYRRLPVEALSKYEGVSVFYAAGPPEAQLCAPNVSPWLGEATLPARPLSGSRAAARSSRCCTAAPTCASRCGMTESSLEVGPQDQWSSRRRSAN
jgi:glycine/D-amino acid oxidase-like deaminating enzyme